MNYVNPIFNTINNELYKLSNHKDWSLKISTNILLGLRMSFRGREMPHWNKIYNQLTKEDLKEILYSNIEDYMYVEVYLIYETPEDDY